MKMQVFIYNANFFRTPINCFVNERIIIKILQYKNSSFNSYIVIFKTFVKLLCALAISSLLRAADCAHFCVCILTQR